MRILDKKGRYVGVETKEKNWLIEKDNAESSSENTLSKFESKLTKAQQEIYEKMLEVKFGSRDKFIELTSFHEGTHTVYPFNSEHNVKVQEINFFNKNYLKNKK